MGLLQSILKMVKGIRVATKRNGVVPINKIFHNNTI